jgi:hypothetical protein
MASLPIRSRVLHYLSTVDEATISQVYGELTPEYGDERQFTWVSVQNHLMNLKENELVGEVHYEVVDDKLDITFSIKDEGLNIVNRYLPKSWRN